MTEEFKETFDIAAGDYAAAGEASAKIKGLLKRIGIDPAVVRRVTIAAYEAEMNIIIHSHGGRMSLSVTPESVHLICSDTGPGIESIEAAMQEGYSTAPSSVRMMGFGAGMGLPNIKHNSDTFQIQSDSGGTTLDMSFRISGKRGS
jgi:anti-sigma regulatory factor (Ser/Thr protein kinase)